MRTRSFLFAPLLLALAQPAAALSCMEPDMFRTLENAQESPESDFVFVGSLTKLDVPPLPNGDQPMRLTAIELTGNGTPVDMEAMGRATCVAQWCGEVADIPKGVFFGTIDSDVGPLVFEFTACGGKTFSNPNPEAIADLGDTIQRIQREAMEKKAMEDAALDGVMEGVASAPNGGMDGHMDGAMDGDHMHGEGMEGAHEHHMAPEGMGVDEPVSSAPLDGTTTQGAPSAP
jgi:hypothetical protein